MNDRWDKAEHASRDRTDGRHARRSVFRNPIAIAAIAAGATLGVWLLFAVLLRLQLYPGLAFGGTL